MHCPVFAGCLQQHTRRDILAAYQLGKQTYLSGCSQLPAAWQETPLQPCSCRLPASYLQQIDCNCMAWVMGWQRVRDLLRGEAHPRHPPPQCNQAPLLLLTACHLVECLGLCCANQFSQLWHVAYKSNATLPEQVPSWAFTLLIHAP